MHDQTLAAYLGMPPEELGTGVFLYVAGYQPNKEFERDVTYFHCANQGATAEAFKWVPNFVAPFEVVSAFPCAGEPCVDSCPGLGCLCNRAKQVCE